MTMYPIESIQRLVVSILIANGTPEVIANQMAIWLIDSDQSGHPSHGVMRLKEYVDAIRLRTIVPDQTPMITREGTSISVDGRFGFGHLGAHFLTAELANRANANGVAVGSLENVYHIGRLGRWSEQAVLEGVVFLMFAGSSQGGAAVPFGGADARLPTNPMTFGAPGIGSDATILDMATTVVAEGKVREAREEGVDLPVGWIVDREGAPSINPDDLYQGGALLPFGGHKGYGLSVMISVLCGALVGADVDNPYSNVLAFALSTEAFGGESSVRDRVSAILRALRGTKPSAGFDRVLVPGDLERSSRSMNMETIELPKSVRDDLKSTAESSDVEFGLWRR